MTLARPDGDCMGIAVLLADHPMIRTQAAGLAVRPS